MIPPRQHKRLNVLFIFFNITRQFVQTIIFSILFLLPLCFVIGYFSIEQVSMAWESKQISNEAGGLKFVYVQKTLILLFPITLLLTIIHKFIENKDYIFAKFKAVFQKIGDIISGITGFFTGIWQKIWN